MLKTNLEIKMMKMATNMSITVFMYAHVCSCV